MSGDSNSTANQGHGAPSQIHAAAPPIRTTFVAADGRVIASFFAQDRVNVPLKRVAPEHYSPGSRHDTTADDLTLWQRLKASVGSLFAAIFTVRHRENGVAALLAPNQEFFLRRNLELRLTAARVALLNGDGQAFSNSVQTARTWLSGYFNVQDPGVKAAIDKLGEMQNENINPELPDISASLALLRRIESPEDKAAP